MSLPPSLALPTDDELRAEQARQSLLQKNDPTDLPGKSGGIVSVNRVPVTPPTPAPAPAPAPAPISEPVPTPAPAPAVEAAPPIAPAPMQTPTPTPAPVAKPLNTGTASDVRPAAPADPLGQRFTRRPTQPSLAEQLSQPAVATQPAPQPVAAPATALAAALAPTPTPQAPNLTIATPANTPVVKPALDPNMDMLAGLEDQSQPRRRRPWLTAIIVVGLLGVGLGVTLWLQSSGTIYNGALQKMVGGFPKSADQALVLMRQKAATTYGLSGQASLIKSTQLPTIGEDNSSSTTAEVSGSIQGSVTSGNWQVYFNWQLANDYPVTGLQGEAMRIDQKRYLYLDTLSLLVTNNSWQEITSDDWSRTAMSAPFEAVDLAGILGRASEGQYLGPNSLTVGEKTYSVAVYQYKVDQANDYADVTYKEGRLLVWVDRSSGQVVEYQLDELMTAGSLGDVVFQSVWVVDSSATVTAIALEDGVETKTGSISSIAMELGFITASGNGDLTTASGRDGQRRTDLLSIKEALAEYYTKTGTYPVSKSVDKTSDSRVLKAALVPSYLESLPVDPKGGTAYYGYTSDGFSFKLTSIVEESTAVGAKQGSGFYYQEITN